MTVYSDAIRQTEECLINAWPSLRTMMCEGWVFREAAGYTKRANSASALDVHGEFRSTLAHAERFYASVGSPTVFRLTPLAGPEPDHILADRDYRIVDDTIVMTADIAGVGAPDADVTIATSCTDDWDAGYAAAHALSPARQTAHRAILARIVPLPTAFATVKMGDRAVAHGLGVFDRGRLGLFDIVTVPEARRKGAARNLLAGLLDWGARQGAQGAWLSVLADNEKAVPLYEQFGFRELYRYHYRVSAQHDGISGSSRTSVARNV